MKLSKNTAGLIIFILIVILAIGFLIVGIEATVWIKFLEFIIWAIGFFYGGKAVTDIVKSVAYRPELDKDNSNEEIPTEDR
jgi:Na+/H+ antiporter NhaC